MDPNKAESPKEKAATLISALPNDVSASEIAHAIWSSEKFENAMEVEHILKESRSNNPPDGGNLEAVCFLWSE